MSLPGGTTMQIGQLRNVIEAFAGFGAVVCGYDNCADLMGLASVFPSGSKQTTAQFLGHLKKSLPRGGRFPSPEALTVQLQAVEATLSSVGAKASADIGSLLALLEASHSIQTEEFTRTLAVARDFVPPAKADRAKPEAKPDAIVAGYIERFRKAGGKTREFEAVLAALKADSKLSDTRVKKISKALWGKPAKTRQEAFDHVLAFQNQEALSASSSKALDLVSV
jgi:hypothetical protein